MDDCEKEFYKAFANFQSKLTAVAKNKTVKVRTKTGGEYQFQYADLADVWEVIREPLTSNGLSILQIIDVEEHTNYLKTSLLHEKGFKVDSKICLGSVGGDIKALGGNITYYRRYAISAMLGVVSDVDADDLPAEEPDYNKNQNTPHRRNENEQKKKQAQPKKDNEFNPLLQHEEQRAKIIKDQNRKAFYSRHGMEKPGNHMFAYLQEIADSTNKVLLQVVDDAIAYEDRFLVAFKKEEPRLLAFSG